MNSTTVTPDYRFFDLAGNHSDLGYELGTIDPPFVPQTWWAQPTSQHFANECLAVLYDLYAPLVDEHRAYAEAQKKPFAAFWRYCCRVNLKAQFRVTAHIVHNGAEGCSSVALRVGGRMVVGRNYDYWSHQTRRQRILFTPHPSTSVGLLALRNIGARGSVPCGRYDGMNLNGVFISLHVVMTDMLDETDIRPGIPFHLVVRLALEQCSTARQARDLLLRIPHLSALNYLVADENEAFVIEADPRAVRVREEDDGNAVATNHFIHPDMRQFQGRRSVHNSHCRHAFLRTQTPPHTADPDEAFAYLERLMADRSVPLCGNAGGLNTLWSCVAQPYLRRIRYAAGAPTHVAFYDMPL